MDKLAQGTLYVVATPIGHLQDMTERALLTLREVDVIAVEDTRHSGRLLQHFEITTPMISLHEHNEKSRILEIIAQLEQGQNIALISDAGTPLIHDPGYHLIKACWAHHIQLVPIPGPCALITALCVAGLPTHEFLFVGFLPAKAQARTLKLEQLHTQTATLIFYEAPHRIKALAQAILNVLGAERIMVIARELTKAYETLHRAPVAAMVEWLACHDTHLKGEFVVIVEGYSKPVVPAKEVSDEAKRVFAILIQELPLKQAVALGALISGEKKNRLYHYALLQQ